MKFEYWDCMTADGHAHAVAAWDEVDYCESYGWACEMATKLAYVAWEESDFFL